MAIVEIESSAHLMTRREFLRQAALRTIETSGAGMFLPWLFSACSPAKKAPSPQQPSYPDQQLSLVQQEVKRLVLTYPEDSWIRKIYLGNVAEINPLFASPLSIGFINPAVYSSIRFGETEYTSDKRFRYFLTSDRSLVDYATLWKMSAAILFSEVWLSTQNDQVKIIALEKEAMQIRLWESFSRIALNTYLSQGEVDRIDPKVTDQEIANTFARNLLIENAEVRKLYDYAGYLGILPKVGELLTQKDPQITAELKYTNLPTIYDLAKKRGILFEGLEFASIDFLRMAFDPNSPWVTIIRDSSLPAPAMFDH